MVPQHRRSGIRRLASIPALLTALASLSLAAACDKVPLLAPSGSVITIFPTAPSVGLNGTVEIAGPEPIRQDEMIRQFFRASGDPRTVVVDPAALYFGTRLNDQSLTPGANVRLGKTRFQDWLKQAVKAA